jgi:hypothetical protein
MIFGNKLFVIRSFSVQMLFSGLRIIDKGKITQQAKNINAREIFIIMYHSYHDVQIPSFFLVKPAAAKKNWGP